MSDKKIPNPIDIQVGSRIRMRRLILGLSQEKLAHGLGITFQQVQKYEKGTNRVGASRLQAISTIMNVSPSFFFETEGQMPDVGVDPASAETRSLSGMLLTKEGIDLNRAFIKIVDPNTRRKIVSLVQVLARSPDLAE